MEADDILQEGFIKVFINLKSFRGEGSLEGWIRRTIVNTAINHYKKNAKYMKDVEVEQAEVIHNNNPELYENMYVEELLKLINDLPVGYRIVFNLYVLEGYTHKEISQLLGVSENTSKSQLSRARLTLQKKLAELQEEMKYNE